MRLYKVSSHFCGTVFDVSEKKKTISEIEPISTLPDFWSDSENAQLAMKKLTEAQNIVSQYETLDREIRDAIELLDMTESPSEIREIQNVIFDLEKKMEKFDREILFSGPYDINDAIVVVQSGAGGVDAQDWAGMILRMYLRWCERNNLKANVLETSMGMEAGIKSATFRIEGRYAYGKLSGEHGTHRLVRLSPFNAKNLRQTSFARVDILPVVERDAEVDISESDLRIDVFRSSGAGGQSVNTTDSAVRITHIPTGIMASCQNERSQLQNKILAMGILRAKLMKKKIQEQEEEQKKIRGEQSSGEWGSQIRSYVIHPYKMVKDHRTKYETAQVETVLDGDIDAFIEAWLRMEKA